jgi:hypothetical protein
MNGDVALRVAVFQAQYLLGLITTAELHDLVAQALDEQVPPPEPGTVTLRARPLSLTEMMASG